MSCRPIWDIQIWNNKNLWVQSTIFNIIPSLVRIVNFVIGAIYSFIDKRILQQSIVANAV